MATPKASSSVLTSLTSQAPSSKTLKFGIAQMLGGCMISTFSARNFLPIFWIEPWREPFIAAF
jgi:hypothetical protein